MKATVSMLLRDFPRVRRTALSGEPVTIKTREGDLLLTAAPPEAGSVIGCLKGQVAGTEDRLDRPTSPASGWKPSL